MWKPEIIGPLSLLLGALVTQAVIFVRDRRNDNRTHLRESRREDYTRLIDENARLLAAVERADKRADEAERERDAFRRWYEWNEKRVTILESTYYREQRDIPVYPPEPTVSLP